MGGDADACDGAADVGFPQPQGVMVAAGGDGVAVGAERRRGNGEFVPVRSASSPGCRGLLTPTRGLSCRSPRWRGGGRPGERSRVHEAGVAGQQGALPGVAGRAVQCRRAAGRHQAERQPIPHVGLFAVKGVAPPVQSCRAVRSERASVVVLAVCEDLGHVCLRPASEPARHVVEREAEIGQLVGDGDGDGWRHGAGEQTIVLQRP